MSVDFEFLGLLCLMLVVRTFVDVKVLEDGVAETVLREHATHGVFEHEDGLALHLFGNGSGTLATRIARVAHVVLLGEFVTRQDHFLCIDDDDIITTIAVGSKACLPFATQNHGNLASQTAEDLSFSVDDIPFLVGILFVDAYCLLLSCNLSSSFCV